MKQLKQKLEYAIYGYDPRQFMPVRYDNRLINRGEFVLYKLRRVIDRLPTPVK